MLNNKKQLLCSNNLILEMEKKFIKSCIWSVAFYGSETGALGKKMKTGLQMHLKYGTEK